jgi:hypothetical protein
MVPGPSRADRFLYVDRAGQLAGVTIPYSWTLR